ncbi:MAG: metalloregulator ArsR/SmtB family transcription factor [Alphaproteobacteria bacterium]|uniref:Metalloregulator ArsR/SmtB family transcription factor n=1 Tax=Candidatus Nitrobium versatile TaxID=2884831 RepID=A0A953JDL1_9BACT|nr:metalloregulator ArsR/SmtB family transcription factor [Candidatus Nitrobium versatile]
MQKALELFKILSDTSRLRLLMLLEQKELCVCQMMGVLTLSQPLVSRNLSLLTRSGFLEMRREGKLMFYRIKPSLPPAHLLALSLVRKLLEGDSILQNDRESLQDCSEFQKQTGKCDMETFKAFMEYRKRKRGEEPLPKTVRERSL